MSIQDIGSNSYRDNVMALILAPEVYLHIKAVAIATTLHSESLASLRRLALGQATLLLGIDKRRRELACTLLKDLVILLAGLAKNDGDTRLYNASLLAGHLR
jgi:hypothetical protein